MPTSELTDALNPFVGQQQQQQQSYSEQHTYTQPFQAAPPPQSSSFVPHRSELEYAISEPPPPPRPKVDAAHLVQELLRALNASEYRRRLAWEQELEAKYQQREAEMETQLAEMKREIACLKISVSSLLDQQPHDTTQASGSVYHMKRLVWLIRRGLPVRVLWSNACPLMRHPRRLLPVSPSGKGLTPSPNDGESDSEDSESEASQSLNGPRPQKRTNNHDKRCYTIQTAMRRHIYRVLGVSPEDGLPHSHHEGLPLSIKEPVRFVWEKTIKQSKHNTQMKDRVLADIRANRRLYRHVPEADFSPKSVSSAFDQAFSTFRQKYKAQLDPTVSLTVKTREEHKAMKSRRLHRKKFKRDQRIAMRERTQAFVHSTFDGAMELECMSSEESDEDSKLGVTKDKVLKLRGIPWRSNRLLKFYSVLDEDDRLDKSLRPKRGLGRRDRDEGPPKDGLTIPPKGVASWMISRRWLRDVQLAHPEVIRAVQELVYDPPGFDWTKFDALGYETDDERMTIDSNTHRHGAQFAPHSSAFPGSTTSYALVDALAPASLAS
ncbi:hypothetical protein EDB89DRAFT_1923303 [Lactarius sanguifluus]|nr:hypothetical protein EDB89DRAFT_1923303 [Lactarius sanguifluus]